MLYIIEFSYNPNTASCNRLLGYFRQWDKKGIEATVYYLVPSSKHDRIREHFSHIHFVYCWNRVIPYRQFIKSFFVNRYIKSITANLKSGDIVYTYSVSSITKACLEKKGVRVYAEITEHPNVCSPVADPTLLLDEKSYYETLTHLDGLFVISSSLKGYFLKLGVSPSKIQIVNMTVDPTRFENVQKIRTPYRYIAYCGTASNTKDGIDELIKAFSLVRTVIPDVRLTIIGSTPRKSEKNANIELIHQLHLEDSIVFTGIVSSAAIPQLLKNADVLVLDRPDNMQAKYGFPTKLGEYLLTGNPVVVTSVGDIPRFLENNISALIVPPSNAELFSQKLIWALNNPAEAKVIGERGRSVALKHFNSMIESDKIIRQMLGI